MSDQKKKSIGLRRLIRDMSLPCSLNYVVEEDYVDVKTSRAEPSSSVASSTSSSPPASMMGGSAAMTLARSMTNPNVVYRFRLANYITLSSNTSGTMDSAISPDPSQGSLPDWSSITQLFDEVKLISSRLTICPRQGSSGGTSNPNYMVGYARSLTGSFNLTGLTYDAVAALPNSYLGNVYIASNPGRVVREAKAMNTLWAPVGTPVGTVDTGCTGVWLFHCTGIDASSYRMDFLMEMFIEVRARA
jgi:hypothetical protein